MIYKTLIGIGIIIVGGLALYNVNNVEEYVAQEVVTQNIVEVVDAADSLVAKAITASSTEIKIQAQKSYDDTVLRISKEIELDVRRGLKIESDSRITELEKEVGEY